MLRLYAMVKETSLIFQVMWCTRFSFAVCINGICMVKWLSSYRWFIFSSNVTRVSGGLGFVSFLYRGRLPHCHVKKGNSGRFISGVSLDAETKEFAAISISWNQVAKSYHEIYGRQIYCLSFQHHNQVKLQWLLCWNSGYLIRQTTSQQPVNI